MIATLRESAVCDAGEGAHSATCVRIAELLPGRSSAASARRGTSAARADADGADQASGLPVLAAVREQQLRLAGSAEAEVGHVGRGNSGALELPPVGEREVEM